MPEIESDLPDDWERSETDTGIPYYVDHKTCRTQWDHPTTTDILREIDQLNYIKFAAYRTAIKMRIIQQRCEFDKVEFLRLLSVFDQLGYGTQQSSDDDEVQDMNVLDLENILVKLFSQPTLANDIELANPLLSTDLALNFALNIFDRDRSGKLKLTAIKIFLTVMCKGYLRDKYQFLFKLIANRGKFANAEGLESLLSQLMQIVSYIKEDPSFGGIHSIQNAVKNCYDKAAHPSKNGPDRLEEEEFTQWVLEEPQTIVWLSTMERVIAAENVVHDVKCGICKKTPIVGLRFKSLKKFNFDICQNCFLSGKSGKHHKAGDPTQEYCVATTSKEGVKDFARTFRNKVTKRYKRKAAKPRYICIENSSSILEETEPQNDQEESSQNQSTNPPDQSQNSTFSQNDANRDGNETEEAEERETAIIDSSFIAISETPASNLNMLPDDENTESDIHAPGNDSKATLSSMNPEDQNIVNTSQLASNGDENISQADHVDNSTQIIFRDDELASQGDLQRQISEQSRQLQERTNDISDNISEKASTIASTRGSRAVVGSIHEDENKSQASVPPEEDLVPVSDNCQNITNKIKSNATEEHQIIAQLSAHLGSSGGQTSEASESGTERETPNSVRRKIKLNLARELTERQQIHLQHQQEMENVIRQPNPNPDDNDDDNRSLAAQSISSIHDKYKTIFDHDINQGVEMVNSLKDREDKLQATKEIIMERNKELEIQIERLRQRLKATTFAVDGTPSQTNLNDIETLPSDQENNDQINGDHLQSNGNISNGQYRPKASETSPITSFTLPTRSFSRPKTSEISPVSTLTSSTAQSSSRPTFLLKSRADPSKTSGMSPFANNSASPNSSRFLQDRSAHQGRTNGASPVPTYTNSIASQQPRTSSPSPVMGYSNSALATSTSPLRLLRNRSDQQPKTSEASPNPMLTHSAFASSSSNQPRESDASPVARFSHDAFASSLHQPRASGVSPITTLSHSALSQPAISQSRLDQQPRTNGASPIHTYSHSAIRSSSPPSHILRNRLEEISRTNGTSPIPTVTPSILPSASSPPIILQSRVGNHFTSSSTRDRLQPTRSAPATNGHHYDYRRYSESNSSNHDRVMGQNVLQSMDSRSEMDYFNQYTADYEKVPQNGLASSDELNNILSQLNSFTVESTDEFDPAASPENSALMSSINATGTEMSKVVRKISDAVYGRKSPTYDNFRSSQYDLQTSPRYKGDSLKQSGRYSPAVYHADRGSSLHATRSLQSSLY